MAESARDQRIVGPWPVAANVITNLGEVGLGPAKNPNRVFRRFCRCFRKIERPGSEAAGPGQSVRERWLTKVPYWTRAGSRLGAVSGVTFRNAVGV